MHDFMFTIMETYYQLLPQQNGSGSFVVFRALFNGNTDGDGTGDYQTPYDASMPMMADYFASYRTAKMIPHTASVVQCIVSGLRH